MKYKLPYVMDHRFQRMVDQIDEFLVTEQKESNYSTNDISKKYSYHILVPRKLTKPQKLIKLE